MANQDYFRQQFYALRSLTKIVEDITLAVRASRAQGDAVAFFRLMLIEHELKERDEVLDQTEMPTLVFSLLGTEALLDYVMDGRDLQIGAIEALKLCKKLIDAGDYGAARILFDAAEPIDLLNGSSPIAGHFSDQRSKKGWIKHWIRCAYYFRSLELILQAISVLTIAPDQQYTDLDMAEEINELRAEMHSILVDEIAEQSDANLWHKLRTLLATLPDGEVFLLQMDFQFCRRHSKHPDANTALERLVLWAEEVGKVELNAVIEWLLANIYLAFGAISRVLAVGLKASCNRLHTIGLAVGNMEKPFPICPSNLP